jgi:glutamate synthase domain-containing protein 2
MIRVGAVGLVGVLGVAVAVLAVAVSPLCWILAGPLLVIAAIGVGDLVQRRHSVLRNYPVLGHFRFLLESPRPELQQYFIERNFDGRPFDRDIRSIVYQRAKGTDAEEPFGTELDVYADGYEFFVHSMAPAKAADDPPTVRIGGPDCAKPYDMALLNVSAMSFGALSGNAILALNSGAAMGGFAHDTGEGGLSEYHLRPGGHLVWEVGTGYFGCRTPDGGFDADEFADKAAHDAVRCVSLKLSQGAKPGIGGVLPGGKVNDEIAHVRDVPAGKTVISPPYHRVSAPRGNWWRSSRGCVSWPVANPPGSSCASARGASFWPCARRCSWKVARPTSSSWTARRAARAPLRWSSPTTSVCRSPRA